MCTKWTEHLRKNTLVLLWLSCYRINNLFYFELKRYALCDIVPKEITNDESQNQTGENERYQFRRPN